MNKIIIFCLSLSVVVSTSSVFADSIDDLIDLLPGPVQTLAKSALSVLPANQRQGVSDYLELIGVDTTRLSNGSIAEFNDKILKSGACTADLAADFYADIARDDIERAAKNGTPYFTNGMSMPLSTQISDLGKKPGWPWEKALQYSKGDKLLALQLIGICGHDDKNQFAPGSFDGIPISPQKIEQLSRKRPSKEFISKVAHNENVRARKELPLSFDDEEADRNQIEEETSFKKGVLCPQATSAFYGPQSLGADYDVSPDLKKRISAVQAPTKGAEALPSKNYHVMGSAYSACFLLRRGVPNFLAKKMAMGAINAYRSSRVCEELSQRELPNAAKITPESVMSDIVKVKKISPNDPCGPNSKEVVPSECEGLANLVDTSELRNMPDDLIKKKVEARLNKADARAIFNRSIWKSYSHNCQGPQLGTAVKNFAARNASSSPKNLRSDCPGYMTPERCDNARKLIETYLIDFQWSEAQHLAGFEFAEKNCPQYDPANTPEMVACKIQGRSSGATVEPASSIK